MVNLENFDQDSIINNQEEEILKKTGFDTERFNKLVLSQQSFNKRVHPEWQNQNFNWDLAIILESAEMLDSFDWKWWKHGVTDWANIEIEMTDIFLFLLSKSISNKTVDVLKGLMINQSVIDQNIAPIRKEDDEIIKMIQVDLMGGIINDTTIYALLSWIKTWNALGYTINDIFKKFDSKNILNSFRQDNGYKEGTYVKIWNDEEDNVVLQRIVESVEYDENFNDQVYKQLEDAYNNVEIVEKTLDRFLEQNLTWKTFMDMVPDENQKVMAEFLDDYVKYLDK